LGGEATKVLDAVGWGWTVGKDGIYFFTVADEKGHADLFHPHDRTILYTQLDQEGSDLMLVGIFDEAGSTGTVLS
jgi:hypothetical protein